MRGIHHTIPLIFVLVSVAALIEHASASEIISNVRIQQINERVVILYDLRSPEKMHECKISVSLSVVRGANDREMSPTSISGDVGDNVAPGRDRRIEWNPLNDLADGLQGYLRVRVSAIVESRTENGSVQTRNYRSGLGVEGLCSVLHEVGIREENSGVDWSRKEYPLGDNPGPALNNTSVRLFSASSSYPVYMEMGICYNRFRGAADEFNSEIDIASVGGWIGDLRLFCGPFWAGFEFGKYHLEGSESLEQFLNYLRDSADRNEFAILNWYYGYSLGIRLWMGRAGNLTVEYKQGRQHLGTISLPEYDFEGDYYMRFQTLRVGYGINFRALGSLLTGRGRAIPPQTVHAEESATGLCIGHSPDLRMDCTFQKAADLSAVHPGDTLAIDVSVENTSPCPARDVRVAVDPLDLSPDIRLPSPYLMGTIGSGERKRTLLEISAGSNIESQPNKVAVRLTCAQDRCNQVQSIEFQSKTAERVFEAQSSSSSLDIGPDIDHEIRMGGIHIDRSESGNRVEVVVSLRNDGQSSVRGFEVEVVPPRGLAAPQPLAFSFENVEPGSMREIQFTFDSPDAAIGLRVFPFKLRIRIPQQEKEWIEMLNVASPPM